MPMTYTKGGAASFLRSKLPESEAVRIGTRYIDLIYKEGHISSDSDVSENELEAFVRKIEESTPVSSIVNSYERKGRAESILRSGDMQGFYFVVAGARRVINGNCAEFKAAVDAAYAEMDRKNERKIKEKEGTMLVERDECLRIVEESHRLLVQDLVSLPPSDSLEVARKYRSLVAKALSGVKRKRLYDEALVKIRSGKGKE